MPDLDPPVTPRSRRSSTTEQIVWRLEDTSDGCVALRAVPSWHPRAYLSFAVIGSVIFALLFVGFWCLGMTTAPIPWWWVALAVVFAAYWPIERAFVQDRARVLFPIVLRPSTGEIGIDGERFAMKTVEAIEHVRVLRDPQSEGGPYVYREIHAIVSTASGLRRIVIVDEGMNGATIATQLARMIGCALRTIEVRGPE